MGCAEASEALALVPNPTTTGLERKQPHSRARAESRALIPC